MYIKYKFNQFSESGKKPFTKQKGIEKKPLRKKHP